MVKYAQQNFVFPIPSELQNTKAISVNNMSDQQTNDVVAFSQTTNSDGESFQKFYDGDYAAEYVVFYQDPSVVKPCLYDTTSIECSESNIDFLPAEENSSIIDLSHCSPESPWVANTEFPPNHYYPAYTTECLSQDEYISSDFTQPLVQTTHPLIGSEKQVHYDHSEQSKIPATGFTTEEPTSGQSNVALFVTGLDEHQIAAATHESAIVPEKSEKEQQQTRLKPMVAAEEVYPMKKSRHRKKVTVSEWKCLPCNRLFLIKRGLLQHNLYYHCGDKPFGCDDCGKRYGDQQAMLQHQRRHKIENKHFKCDQCTRQYHHRYDLARHISLHHGVTKYKCKYCGKPFDRNDHVIQHEASHEKGTVKRKRMNRDM